MRLIYTYVPFQVLIGVVFGILCNPQTTLPFYCLGVVLLLLITLLLILNKKKKQLGKTYLFFLAVVLFGVLSVWCSQYITNNLNNQQHYQYKAKENNYVEFVLTKKLKSTQKYKRFYAEVLHLNNQKVCGKILVEFLKEQSFNIEIGNVLICKTKLHPISLPASPYHFNYKSYLARKNIFAKIRVQSYVQTGRSNHFFITIQKFRNKIVAALEKANLSNNTKGLMMAMLLGDRDGIADETQKAFVNAGVVHLIAISGMHVGVLYFLLLITFKFLKQYKYGTILQTFLILCCLWTFAIFSGLSSSVVRCVTMFSFIVISKIIRRKTLLLEPIISSALILLWIYPNYLFDAGFQLSYAAVINIVVFYPLITRKYKFSNKVIQYFFDVLLVSIIAQLGVLPISLYYFHQFPFQFLIANFFAVSLLPLVLYGGLLVLLKILFVKSCVFIETSFDTGILFYLRVIKNIAEWDHWIVKNVFFSDVYVLAYYLMLLFVWKLLKDFRVKNMLWLLTSVVVFQVVVLSTIYYRGQKEQLIIENNYFSPSVKIIKGTNLFVFDKYSLIGANALLIKNNIDNVYYMNNKVFQFKKDCYLIVSEKLEYEKITQKGMVLILRNNPKVNLERIVYNLQPKKVIVEANNYFNNVLKWKSTCKKLQVPFYDVKSSGAFVFTTDF